LKIGRASDASATYLRLLCLKSSDTARLEVVEAALLSLQAGINWKDANMLLEELKLLRRRLGLSVQTHDTAEITAIARSFRLGGDPANYVGQLTGCVTASDASPAHKLAASRQLLMTAEMTMDMELAKFAYLAVSDSSSDSLSHALTAMLFHTCFGTPAEAKRLASLVFERTQGDPAFLPYVLNAAYAEYRIGDWRVAETRFAHALHLTRRGNSRAGEMHARFLLARLYYSLVRLESARTWYDSFRELLSEISDEELVWEHNLLGARLSGKEGEIDIARNHVEDARSSAFSGLPMPALAIRACDLELRLLEGREPCTIVEIDELLALHRRNRAFGGQDDVVRALCNALRLHGRESEARTLVQEYLTLYRRDGYPPDPALAIALG